MLKRIEISNASKLFLDLKSEFPEITGFSLDFGQYISHILYEILRRAVKFETNLSRELQALGHVLSFSAVPSNTEAIERDLPEPRILKENFVSKGSHDIPFVQDGFNGVVLWTFIDH